jgi:hypothetical protein
MRAADRSRAHKMLRATCDATSLRHCAHCSVRLTHVRVVQRSPQDAVVCMVAHDVGPLLVLVYHAACFTRISGKGLLAWLRRHGHDKARSVSSSEPLDPRTLTRCSPETGDCVEPEEPQRPVTAPMYTVYMEAPRSEGHATTGAPRCMHAECDTMRLELMNPFVSVDATASSALMALLATARKAADAPVSIRAYAHTHVSRDGHPHGYAVDFDVLDPNVVPPGARAYVEATVARPDRFVVHAVHETDAGGRAYIQSAHSRTPVAASAWLAYIACAMREGNATVCARHPNGCHPRHVVVGTTGTRILGSLCVRYDADARVLSLTEMLDPAWPEARLCPHSCTHPCD